MAGPLTQTNPMVEQAAGGNTSVQELLQNMLQQGQQRQGYLEQQQAAYNRDMERYAQMVEQARQPESNEAAMWGSMAGAAAKVRPEVGNLGQMLGAVGGAYGGFQDQQQRLNLKNQADLTKLRQAEVRALESKDQNAAMLRALTGGSKSGMSPVVKVVDGKLVKYDPLTNSTEVLTGSQDQIKKNLFTTFFNAGVKNEMANPEEYARQQTEKALAQFGGTTVKGEANAIPGVRSAGQDIVTDDAEKPNFKFDVSRLSPEDRDLVKRVISRYQANPNEGTKAQTVKILGQIFDQGGIKMAQPEAPSLTYPDKPKKEAAIESSKEGAKMYAESFNTDVLKPLQSFQDTGRIMQDFNNLGAMNAALKNGKLKEFMAGETGRWAMSFLPEDSELRKGIANAQEAEKLTQQMVNKILLAAKGVQTEGDAQRARSQITSIGIDPDANKYIEAFISETARQLKLREQYGLAHKNQTGNWEGYDQAWQNNPLMKEAKGSVKKLGSQWIGLTQYVDKFKAKYPEATDSDAVASWNRVK